MTVIQIDRAKTQEAARTVRPRPAATLLAARMTSKDGRAAEDVAATATLVAALALLVAGLVLAAFTSLNVSRLHGLLLTAAVASAPFAIAAFVYTLHRLGRLVANQ